MFKGKVEKCAESGLFIFKRNRDREARNDLEFPDIDGKTKAGIDDRFISVKGIAWFMKFIGEIFQHFQHHVKVGSA